jgi:methionyl-tRNA formyltransferase
MCQPVIRCDVRTHHGVTLHEMDEQIDHGPIYRVKRWDVPEDATIESVLDRSFAECSTMLEEAVSDLARSPNGTECLAEIGERWDPTNRYHTPDDLREWFQMLDPGHPAHQERVIFNHPRAIISPPYFDDI